MTTPTQNPRSNALVGLLWPAPEEEFQRRWREKYPPDKGEINDLNSWGSGPTNPFPAPPGISDDAQKKAAAEKNFLGEVNRIFDRGGISYGEAYAEAASTAPGATFFKILTRGSAKEFASSGPIPAPPDAPGDDRYDPRLESQLQDQFVARTKELALDMNFQNQGEAWAFASNTDPEGKKLFSEWKKQSALKKKSQFSKNLEGHPPSFQTVEQAARQ
jgi:hypothetical protein